MQEVPGVRQEEGRVGYGVGGQQAPAGSEVCGLSIDV